MVRKPHEPTDAWRSLRTPPRHANLRSQAAQERRRTAGAVRSVDQRFIILPDDQILRVYDETDTLRVELGLLDPSTPEYGLKVYDNTGTAVFTFDGTGLLLDVTLGTTSVKGSLTVDNATTRFIGGNAIQVEDGAILEFYDGVNTFVGDIRGASGDLLILADMQLGGGGDKVAFFGGTPVAKQTLGDSTGGTSGSSLSAVSGTGDDSTINDNFASIRALLAAYGLV